MSKGNRWLLPEGIEEVLPPDAAQLDGLSPVKLLAMLKHPLCATDPWAVAALEHAILRGPRPKAGSDGLRQALRRFRDELGKLRRREDSDLHRFDPRAGMKDAELDAADTEPVVPVMPPSDPPPPLLAPLTLPLPLEPLTVPLKLLPTLLRLLLQLPMLLKLPMRRMPSQQMMWLKFDLLVLHEGPTRPVLSL